MKLVKASKRYSDLFLRGLKEYKKDTAKFGLIGMRKTMQMVDDGKFDDWLKQARDYERGINMPVGWISSTRYWLIDGDEYIGSFTLRHDINKKLMKCGGHVGYVIAPSKRGRGYAFAGLQLVLKEAAKRGLERVLITCDTENAASFAVINKAKNMYGGKQLKDSPVNNRYQHRVWINTKENKMQLWEKALNKFLKKYINQPWFEGALLCGSYASGNQNKFSDIDVTIVGKNDMGFQEKSNCYVDGFLMEYTINPVYKVQEYMKSGLERHSFIDQNMYAYGVILHDKHGVMKKLHQQALRDLKKKIKPISEYSKGFRKYHLWDKYDELRSLKSDGYHTDLIYWLLVDGLIDAYYDFNCLPYVSHAKIEKILTNKDFAKRYHADKLPNKQFTKLLLGCFNAKQKDKMSAIDALYKYVMKSGGGFDIGQFRGRRKIEKK